MIYHGMVHDVDDPDELGRVRVRVIGFRDDVAGMDITPWCHACSPFAGTRYGLFVVPQVGDEAIVARMESGDWVVLGYHWSGRKGKPYAGDADTVVFRTSSGHMLSFTEGGSILIQTEGEGADIEIKHNGIICLNGSVFKVMVEDSVGGFVCGYTGHIHGRGTNIVKAGG